MNPLSRLIALTAVLFASAIHCANADSFEIVTAHGSDIIGAQYFGAHFHRLVLMPGENAVKTEWPSFTLGSVRLWDSGVSWRDISKQPGEYQFRRFDTYIDAAVAHRATVLYTLGSTPAWASARPGERCPYGFGCGAEPVDQQAWLDYVRRVALRYGSRITDYEMWNEPNFSDFPRDAHVMGFYTGSIAALVELTRAARTILDQVSPKAKLCTPGFVNGPDRLDRYLAAGGRRYVQAVCYHFYSGDSAHFARQIQEVREIMKRHGLERLPLWNTETGVDTLKEGDPPSGIAAHTHEGAVARLSQMLVLGAAAGIDRFYYYAWDNFRSGMVRADGSHLPGYAALQQLQSWMLGSRLTGCSGHGDLVQCDGVRGAERFVIAWSDKSSAAPFDLPNGWSVSGVDRLATSELPISDGPLLVGPTPMRIRLSRQPVN